MKYISLIFTLLLTFAPFTASAECVATSYEDNINQTSSSFIVCSSREDSNAMLLISCNESNTMRIGVDAGTYVGSADPQSSFIRTVPTQVRGSSESRPRRYWPSIDNTGTLFVFSRTSQLLETIIANSELYIRYTDYRGVSSNLTFDIDSFLISSLACYSSY